MRVDVFFLTELSVPDSSAGIAVMNVLDIKIMKEVKQNANI